MAMKRTFEGQGGISDHTKNLEAYASQVVPLLKKGEYDKAMEYLLENPEVKDYLHTSDWKQMCEYFFIKSQRKNSNYGEFKELEGMCG